MVAVVPLKWSSGSRFFNASLLPVYTSTPLPVIQPISATNARLQSDYALLRQRPSLWTHTAFVPPSQHSQAASLAPVFSAAAAALVGPPSKRRKAADGSVAQDDDEVVDKTPHKRSYKITMLPSAEQRRELKRVMDVCRIAYNYANQQVCERIDAGCMSVLQAANFQTIRNDWNNSERGRHPCTAGILNKHACGAIQQLVDAYKSNEARKRKQPWHTYTVKDRDAYLTETETIPIECDSKDPNSKKKTSPLSRFAPSPHSTGRRPECLAFLGGNLKATGGIRLRDSRRVIDRLLADGKRLRYTSFIQWDKRINVWYFLYSFELPRLEDPDPLFTAKQIVSTDPGSRPFQHWYSPTSCQHGELLSDDVDHGAMACGQDLSRRLRCIRERVRNLKRRKKAPDSSVKSRKRCQRNRRLKQKLNRERVRLHNWMRCAHYDAAKFLLERHDLLIQPWLKVHRLVQQDGLSKAGKQKLTGWSHHKFRDRLVSASARYPGRHVIVSEEPGTSGTCTHCGNWKVGLGLSDKVYECQNCGLCVDRQLAGARNNFLAAYGCARRVGWDGVDVRKAVV